MVHSRFMNGLRDAKSACHTDVVALDLAVEILMACLPVRSQKKRPRAAAAARAHDGRAPRGRLGNAAASSKPRGPAAFSAASAEPKPRDAASLGFLSEGTHRTCK